MEVVAAIQTLVSYLTVIVMKTVIAKERLSGSLTGKNPKYLNLCSR